MGKHHCSKDERGNCLHSVHVSMTEQDIIIDWGVNNFNVDENSLSPEFYRDILEETFRI
jgi:hypothetical protein